MITDELPASRCGFATDSQPPLQTVHWAWEWPQTPIAPAMAKVDADAVRV
jgi:hypothetical protein